MSSYENVRDWRRNTKCRLIQGFGGACGACGLVDHPVVYDFHHLDGSDKEFSISTRIRAWRNIVAEAEKCVMLCAPCHRKHHVGVLELPADITKFSEERIDREVFYDACPVCFTQKPKSQKTCSRSCGAKRRTRYNWTKEYLSPLLDKYGSAYQMSKHLGISDVTIRKHLKRLGLVE